MKAILLRAAVAVVLAALLPLAYPLARRMGIPLDIFTTAAVSFGLLIAWPILGWLEPIFICKTPR